MYGEMDKGITASNNTAYVANVYDVSDLSNDYGSINKVMFYSKEIGATYNMYIVPLNDNEQLSNNLGDLGVPLATGTVNREGYTTVGFRNSFNFDTSTKKIAVVIGYTKEYDPEDDSIALSTEVTGNSDFATYSYAGESLYYNYNQWCDNAGPVSGNVSTRGNFCINPTLVRRNSVTRNSALSDYYKQYYGYHIDVNVILNGNSLYKIKEKNGPLLYQDQEYTLTDNNDGSLTVSFKNSYLSSLDKREQKKIQFIFTDGDSKVLTITNTDTLPAVSLSGKVAKGQTLNAVLNGTPPVVPDDVDYKWWRSSDGSNWTEISNANCNQYTIQADDLNCYIKVGISAKIEGVYSQGIPNNAITHTKVVLYGDADLDGRVNIRDATLISKYLGGAAELSAEQIIAGDVNGNGYIDENDANLITQYCGRVINRFPVEN